MTAAGHDAACAHRARSWCRFGRCTGSGRNWVRGGQVMAPVWLTVVAWLYLSVCFCCAGSIAYDIAVNHRRQPMGVMNVVFPITALYLGPFALALYWRWGRAAARTMAPVSTNRAAVPQAAVTSAGGGPQLRGGQHADHEMAGAAGPGGADEPAPADDRARPWWVTMAIEVSHCGAGCTLGDVISEFAIFWAGPHDRWPHPRS